jgi:hypothetical protein
VADVTAIAGPTRPGAATGRPVLAHVRHVLAGHGTRLLRAWPRDEGHVLLHVTDAAAPSGWAGGQWFADDERAAATARRAPGARHLSGTGVVLQPGGSDHRLPGLAPLLARPGAVLVAHRPGRRAVVRLPGPGDVAGSEVVWAKVVRPGRAAALARTAGWRPDGVPVPVVIGADVEAGVVTTASLPGTALHDLDGVPGAVRWAAWEATGGLLARVHASAPPAGTAPHRLDDEVALTGRWLRLARALGALDAATADRLATAVADHARAVAGDERASLRPVTLHRDLHDKQVLVDGLVEPGAGPRPGVLDLDLVARGAPALDLGNLLAHLGLRALQRPGCRAHDQDLASALVQGYRSAGGSVPGPWALCAHLGLSAARLAAVYGFRSPDGADPGGPAVVAGLVELARGGRPFC